MSDETKVTSSACAACGDTRVVPDENNFASCYTCGTRLQTNLDSDTTHQQRLLKGVETFDAGLECAAHIVPEIFCPKHEKDTCTRCVVQAIRARKEDPNEEYTCGHCGKGVRGKFLFCSKHCIEAAGFSDFAIQEIKGNSEGAGACDAQRNPSEQVSAQTRRDDETGVESPAPANADAKLHRDDTCSEVGSAPSLSQSKSDTDPFDLWLCDWVKKYPHNGIPGPATAWAAAMDWKARNDYQRGLEDAAKICDAERVEYEKSMDEFDKRGDTRMGTNEARCAATAQLLAEKIRCGGGVASEKASIDPRLSPEQDGPARAGGLGSSEVAASPAATTTTAYAPVGLIEELAEKFVSTDCDADPSLDSHRLAAKLAFQAGWRESEKYRGATRVDISPETVYSQGWNAAVAHFGLLTRAEHKGTSGDSLVKPELGTTASNGPASEGRADCSVSEAADSAGKCLSPISESAVSTARTDEQGATEALREYQQGMNNRAKQETQGPFFVGYAAGFRARPVTTDAVEIMKRRYKPTEEALEEARHENEIQLLGFRQGLEEAALIAENSVGSPGTLAKQYRQLAAQSQHIEKETE